MCLGYWMLLSAAYLGVKVVFDVLVDGLGAYGVFMLGCLLRL